MLGNDLSSLCLGHKSWIARKNCGLTSSSFSGLSLQKQYPASACSKCNYERWELFLDLPGAHPTKFIIAPIGSSLGLKGPFVKVPTYVISNDCYQSH